MTYAIPPFLTAAVFLLSGAFAIYKDSKATANRSLAFLCATTFVWQLVVGALLLAKDDQTASFLVKVVYSWVIFIPVAFYHFMIHFGGNKTDRILRILCYLSGFCFLILLWTTPYFINGFHHYQWGYYPKAGPLHPLYLLIHLVFYPNRGLYRVFKEANNKNRPLEMRRHAQYVGLSVLAYYPASVDFLDNYGVGLYPIGFIFTLVSLLILSYAVIKHHLLNISIFIRRGLVYSIVVTGVTLFYLISVFMTESLFRGFFGYRSVIFSIMFACFVALLFQPFKNRIQAFVDNRFFKGTLETLAGENRRLQEEIQKSDQLRIAGALASSIAHEINNPLISIKTFTNYLPQRHQDKSFIEQFKTVVGEELNRIESLVKDLKNFAKPHPPKFESFDIHKSLDHTFGLINSVLASHNISLVRAYHRPNTEVMGDPSQLQQAFLNLFLNAMDAMPNGGELRVATHSEDGWLTIGIEDTGVGMTKEQLEHIFEPFYSTKEGGTGLGLAITKRIIEDHKGKIKVTSNSGKGSTFEILLPLAERIG